MGYAELIERVKSLPPEKRAEVFDFVEFLASQAQREATSPEATSVNEWTDDEFAQFAYEQLSRGTDADPVTYSLDDLKERWN